MKWRRLREAAASNQGRMWLADVAAAHDLGEAPDVGERVVDADAVAGDAEVALGAPIIGGVAAASGRCIADG